MQDPKDETKFCIVERYEQESSQQYHLSNPVGQRHLCISKHIFLCEWLIYAVYHFSTGR